MSNASNGSGTASQTAFSIWSGAAPDSTKAETRPCAVAFSELSNNPLPDLEL